MAGMIMGAIAYALWLEPETVRDPLAIPQPSESVPPILIMGIGALVGAVVGIFVVLRRAGKSPEVIAAAKLERRARGESQDQDH